MHEEQSFPPNGRSGRFLVLASPRAVTVRMRGIPGNFCLHFAQRAFPGSLFWYVIVTRPPGVRLATLLNRPDFSRPCGMVLLENQRGFIKLATTDKIIPDMNPAR